MKERYKATKWPKNRPGIKPYISRRLRPTSSRKRKKEWDQLCRALDELRIKIEASKDD